MSDAVQPPGVRPGTVGTGHPPTGRRSIEEWPAVPLTRAELFPVLVMAGVWLVFLAIPLFAIVSGPAGLGLKVLGVTAILLFAAVYLGHFIHPWPVRSQPLWVNTAGFTALLVLCMLAAVPGAGLTAFNAMPFVLAVWIFPHRLMVGIPVALGIVVSGVVVAWWFAEPDDGFWLILPLGLALVIMVSMRLAQEREESAQALQQQLAVSRNREQFGRDVHDILGHSLTVITLKTELARRLVEQDPQRAQSELDEVLSLSRQALSEVRTTVGGLHVPDLDAQLASARTALDTAGITARLPTSATTARLPAARRELFAWCLREAVTNVIRHADATHCTVTITADRFTVRDDGRGLPGPVPPVTGPTSDPSPASAGLGSGLRGLRQRVTEAGGLLSVRPAQQGGDRPGTIVEVVL